MQFVELDIPRPELPAGAAQDNHSQSPVNQADTAAEQLNQVQPVKKTVIREKKYRIYNTETADEVAKLILSLSLSKQWEVIVKPYSKRRSSQQNSLYWKWLGIIADELGDDANSLHDTFRQMFLPVKVENIFGVERKKLQSTSDPAFTSAMMADYMTKIQALASSELAIILPTREQFENHN